MPRKKQKIEENNLYENSLLSLIFNHEDVELKNLIKNMLKMRPSTDTWCGIIATPPHTLLELIISEFNSKTNIPLEIPFFTFFHFFAAYLLNHEIVIQYRRENIRTDIWTVILAPSGSAKTFTRKCLMNSISDFKGLSESIEGIVSQRGLIEVIEKNNHKLLYRDEFNELYTQMLSNGQLANCKDIFLRAYDNSDISWQSKKDSIYVKNVAFVFLGTTIKDIFLQDLTARDVLSGFMQRISILIAEKDSKKDFRNYPFYDINYDAWQDEWDKLTQSIKHGTYLIDENAERAYTTTFRMLADIDIDESFYRRQLWKTIKYSLIYHILLGKGEEKIICPEAFGWAARVAYLMLSDTIGLLKEHDKSELQKKLQAVDKIRQKCNEKNVEFTARAVVTGTRLIKTVAEAKALMSLL